MCWAQSDQKCFSLTTSEGPNICTSDYREHEELAAAALPLHQGILGSVNALALALVVEL